MKMLVVAILGVVVLLDSRSSDAQTWTGTYLGGSIGGGFQRDDAAETVRFDTNLDGTFTDTIRTAAGADAFSPGFCGGLAVNAMAAGGCTDDENGLEIGGRLGYDRQVGALVVGGLLDISRTDVVDSVTAFSTTPAFYSLTRRMNYAVGFRGRAGGGSDRVLVYGTGGAVWGNIDQIFTTSNAVNTFVPRAQSRVDNDDAPRESVWGYQAGGGVEVRMRAGWSLTGEYLFTSLDNRSASTIRVQGPAPATNPFILVNASGTDLRRSEKFDFQSLRIGISNRF